MVWIDRKKELPLDNQLVMCARVIEGRYKKEVSYNLCRYYERENSFLNRTTGLLEIVTHWQRIKSLRLTYV